MSSLRQGRLLALGHGVHVYGRQVVVPVVVGGPGPALVALRLAPHRAALRAPAVRVERVPGVPALTGPRRARRGLPLALRAVDFHSGAESRTREAQIKDCPYGPRTNTVHGKSIRRHFLSLD